MPSDALLPLLASGQTLPRPDAVPNSEAAYLLLLILLILLLLIVFGVGIFIMLRIGSRLKQREPAQPTEYTDAWSQYRLTEEEVAAATDDLPTPEDRQDKDPDFDDDPPQR